MIGKVKIQCAKCGAALRPNQILSAGRFPCPACGVLLRASSSHGRWIAVGNPVFSALALLALGISGLHLIYGVILAWLPVQYFAINLLKYVIPPKIEVAISGDGILRLRDGPRS